MKTPITDAAAYDVEESRGSTRAIPNEAGACVDSDLSRRLELDRAALMEALEASERISQAIKRGQPMSEGHFNAMVDEFEAKRESALSAARANFP